MKWLLGNGSRQSRVSNGSQPAFALATPLNAITLQAASASVATSFFKTPPFAPAAQTPFEPSGGKLPREGAAPRHLMFAAEARRGRLSRAELGHRRANLIRDRRLLPVLNLNKDVTKLAGHEHISVAADQR